MHDTVWFVRPVLYMVQEAFATVREGSKRVLGLRPFDVQLIGKSSTFILRSLSPRFLAEERGMARTERFRARGIFMSAGWNEKKQGKICEVDWELGPRTRKVNLAW